MNIRLASGDEVGQGSNKLSIMKIHFYGDMPNGIRNQIYLLSVIGTEWSLSIIIYNFLLQILHYCEQQCEENFVQ